MLSNQKMDEQICPNYDAASYHNTHSKTIESI